jgi:hypothetical protein
MENIPKRQQSPRCIEKEDEEEKDNIDAGSGMESSRKSVEEFITEIRAQVKIEIAIC